MSLGIRRLDTATPGFAGELRTLLAYADAVDEGVERAAHAILGDVRARGDDAVLEYTARFDGVRAATMAELRVPEHRMAAALAGLPAPERAALETAAARIRTYHERQLSTSWRVTEPDGTELGQKVTPLDRAGLYVPGGKAAYPSSLLMNAIPAKVAGVGELVMVSPAPGGQINPLVLAAAAVAGVDVIYTIGGAQAVGALAYGTQTIRQVDKIVGPGNAYVAAAKRRVFGAVGIDMIAGPSEILIIADGCADPAWMAMDLFSQAEHDEIAQAILLCPDQEYIEKVAAAADRLLPDLPRRDIVTASMNGRGALIRTRDLAEACDVANDIAPEHLELAVSDPEALLPRIRHAGAIFMGVHSSEALGDYCAGPNHVLPTSRTARFSSPLGVYDFQKRSSVIKASPAGAAHLGRIAAVLAEGEGLQAHARSARYRT
ncbi:MAG: histidinol dehydrogenase [Burkholderiales bacterium]|nr:histidinol dehydrogenase [Burkholderiales bacterium]